MTMTYEEIERIAADTRASVVAAGYDLSKCVWELSPAIWRTICLHHETELLKVDVRRWKGQNSFMGIPVRDGVTDEETGILLKQVNQNRHE